MFLLMQSVKFFIIFPLLFAVNFLPYEVLHDGLLSVLHLSFAHQVQSHWYHLFSLSSFQSWGFVFLCPLLGIPAPQLLAWWQILILWFKEKIAVADMACPSTFYNSLIIIWYFVYLL